MTLTTELLRAKHIGVRELGRRTSAILKSSSVVVIEVKEHKNKVLLAQEDLVQLLELVEDLQDRELLELVKESRAASAAGLKEIPVQDVFKKRK